MPCSGHGSSPAPWERISSKQAGSRACGQAMPTYEYSCDDCGYEFEREQRITESPIKKCPQCGKLKARRLIGGGNFILKGGGWESDLYSGPSNRTEKAGKAKDASQSSPSEAATSSSTDTKKEKKAPKRASESKSPSKATGTDK